MPARPILRFLDAVVSTEERVQGELNEALMQADMTRAINRAGGEVDWTKRRPITISIDGVTHLFDYDRSIDNKANCELIIVKGGDTYAVFIEGVIGWRFIPVLLEAKMPQDELEYDEAEDWFASLGGTLALLDMFRDRL